MSALLTVSTAALLFASTAAAPSSSARPASAAPASAVRAAAHGSLPWIEDDYAHAMAEAKRRGVPVFVEAWATW